MAYMFMGRYATNQTKPNQTKLHLWLILYILLSFCLHYLYLDFGLLNMCAAHTTYTFLLSGGMRILAAYLCIASQKVMLANAKLDSNVYTILHVSKSC
jgi:hypothetical protein